MTQVLHLITSLEAGGAQSMLARLVRSSNGARWRHSVVAMIDDGEHVERLRSEGIDVTTLGMVRGRAAPSGVLRFAAAVRRARPAIVQSWLYHADLLALVAKPLVGAAVIWNVRCGLHERLNGRVARWCARMSRWPEAIVVNSEAGRRVHAEHGYRPSRWELIGNGFDLDVFTPCEPARAHVRRELGLDSGTPLVGLIARFDPDKDHVTFLRAAAELARRHADVHFVLAGADVTENNATLRAHVNLISAARVHLLGPRRDIPRLTAALDIAACTSVTEAFPNVVGEAMACAVPCVVTDVGDASAIVDDPTLVVPQRDPVALANTWERLLRMPAEERRAIGDAARLRIASHYGLTAIVARYERLYESILSSCAA